MERYDENRGNDSNLRRADTAAIEALLDLNSAKQISLPKEIKRSTRKVIENKDGRTLVIKGAWSSEEDYQMLEACKNFGFEWKKVASCVLGRSAKQCRDRYRLKLDPNINHGPWTPEEDERLLELHNEMGRCWTKISKLLPGRTENAVKSRYSSLFRAKTKEWSESEECLLQNLHSKGVNFSVIAKEHLPHRSEHAVKKRWEKMLMKEIATKIKKDMPSLKRKTTSGSVGSKLPRLNPVLAAATLNTVMPDAENELEGSSADTKGSFFSSNPALLANLQNSSIQYSNAMNFINNAHKKLSINSTENIQQASGSRLNRTHTASSNFSTGSAFLLPNLLSSVEKQKIEPEEKESTKEKSVNFEETKSVGLEHKAIRNIKKNRLKRYSTSTTVMMQLIGEPIGVSTQSNVV